VLSNNNEKIKIIGLGTLAGLLVDELRRYPEYRVYKIVAGTSENNAFSLGSFKTMQEYEEKIPESDLDLYLEGIQENQTVLLVLEGGEPITGATLRILELIKHANLTVMFIQPSTSLKSDTAALNSRLAFGALQEYARSGLLNRMFFVQKSRIESLVGDVPINMYEKRIAEILSYKIAMLYFFENSDSVISTTCDRPVGCRLATIGISTLDTATSETRLLFPLEDTRTIEFYYGIPHEQVETSVELMAQIKHHISKHFDFSEESTSFSYKVVPIDNDEPYLLGAFYVSEPQKF
jgi:hypothetical protein